MAFDIMTLLVGSGGGFVGFLGGAIQQRYSAEGRYNKRVDERLELLEQQVEECRKRDGHIAVLSLGLKMIVPEVLRDAPTNPILRHVAAALSALPAEDKSFDELIQQLNEIPL